MRQLEEAIRRAPDDDEPRLVYADWWEARGEPERAQLIRAQLASDGRPLTDVDAIVPRARAHELEVRHGDAWLAREARPVGVELHGFWRGVVHEASVGSRTDIRSTLAELSHCSLVSALSLDLPVAPDVLRGLSVPKTLRFLWLHDGLESPEAPPEVLDALAVSPWLSQLQGVGVFCEHDAPTPHLSHWLGRLLGSPALQHLTALQVESYIHPEAVEAIVAAAGPGLRSLAIKNESGLDTSHVDELCGWSGLERLEALSLAWTRVSGAAIARLLTCPRLQHLQRIGVPSAYRDDRWNPRWGDPVMRPTAIDVHGHTLDAETMMALGEAPWTESVRELDLFLSDHPPGALAALGETRLARHLEVLVTSDAVSLSELALARWPKLHTLVVRVREPRDLEALRADHGLVDLRYLNLEVSEWQGQPSSALGDAQLPQLIWLECHPREVLPDDSPLAAQLRRARR